jgi:hypothetical protein
MPYHQFKDETGKTYNRLHVDCFAYLDNFGAARWHCTCVCGEKRVVAGKDLRSGHSQSCGCYCKDRTAEFNRLNKTLRKNLIRALFGEGLYPLGAPHTFTRKGKPDKEKTR